tara:strand:+ start:125 stop:460 length:336 start_codon:yes stop_codon:yes gene_type:complete
MVSCPDIDGNYQDAFVNETVWDVPSGIYCPFYDSVGQTNSAAVIMVFGLACYVGLVNRSFEVLAIYIILTFSIFMYVVVWAPFNALVFLSLAGSLGFGLYLLYRRLGSTIN